MCALFSPEVSQAGAVRRLSIGTMVGYKMAGYKMVGYKMVGYKMVGYKRRRRTSNH